VPQKHQLDPETPLRGRDLVALGIDGQRWGIPLPSRKRRAQIDEALRAVDALSYADAPVGKLSGGEQQRLLIAQALLADPRILLLDEPLSHLDLRSANEVVRLVASIGRERGVAVLLVAHDINPLLGVMDRVLYLAEGRAAAGPVDEVVRSEVLSALYGYPVDVLHVRGRILVVGGSEVLVGGQFEHEAHAHD
jgi:zinc/manganese transport system ATP-binding protein